MRIDGIGYRGGTGGGIWRLDFARVIEVARRGELGKWAHSGGVEAGPRSLWTLPKDLQRVVFLSGGDIGLTVEWDGQNAVVEAAACRVELDVEGVKPDKRVYTSSNFDAIVELAAKGGITLLPAVYSCRGIVFQQFVENWMTPGDWVRMGFSPAQLGRPALDLRGEPKYEDGRYICLPHSTLEEAGTACPTLWHHFVDSCWSGVYFSKLVVEHLVHSGPVAGWPESTVVIPHPEFIWGAPYRRAGAGLRTSKEGRAQLASAVWHKGAQYLSFDPLAVGAGVGIQARWRTPGGWDSGEFAAPNKYEDAREIRRTHYIPPRTRTVAVWVNGMDKPEPRPCVLSRSGGARYSKRPDKSERRRLVSVYGKDSVPRNFNKYTEGQIAKKSELLRRVAEEGWVHVPSGADGGEVMGRTYNKRGGTSGVDWYILRQILRADEIQSDPFGDGVYSRLPSRDEIFAGDYLCKLVRIMEKGGWGFLVREIVVNPDRLRKNLLTMALS